MAVAVLALAACGSSGHAASSASSTPSISPTDPFYQAGQSWLLTQGATTNVGLGQLPAACHLGVDQPDQELNASEKPYWLAGCLAEAQKLQALATASPS
ncbi:hypothetical protein ACFQZC_01265 [Streptacidiphilus monticola]